MSVRQANGTIVTQSTLMTQMTDVTPSSNKLYQYTGTAKYYKAYTLPGRIAANFEKDRALAFIPGQTYTLDQINAYYPPASITSITPATGVHTSTTAVTVKGSGFSGAQGMTVGGNACTSFTVVDDQTITCVVPTNAAAGAQNVVLTDDQTATVTVTNGFTYS